MTRQLDWVDLFGRVFLSLIFLLTGVQKIFGWSQTESYMASRGLPAIPVLLALAIAIEIFAGLSLLLGYMTRRGALLLFLYLLPVTLSFHAFWTYGGGEMQNQMSHFLKNLTIMGALLFVTAHGPGRLSLDWRIGSRRNQNRATRRPLRAA